MAHETLSRTALNRALLARQMLLERAETPTREAVARLVGLQAQQPSPPFVGLWTRVAGFERKTLLALLHGRQIVRATLLRGTLHLATMDDYLWLRAVLQPALTAGMQSVLRQRANALDIDALVAVARRSFVERPRTFGDLRAELMERFPDGDERAMGYAVRTHLPLVAQPDDSEWGFSPDPRFADAESWLGRSLDRDQNVHELVFRYLAAFGPATAADIQTWSGLRGAASALKELRPKLQIFRDERRRDLFDLPDAPRPSAETPAPVRFLPGFDNVILSHADRTRIIADEHRPRVTTKNLQVLPTFLVDGFVAGTWKSTRARSIASLTISPFTTLPKSVRDSLAEEGKALLHFLEPDLSRFEVAFESA